MKNLSLEQMKLIEGGDVSLKMDPYFRSKDNCKRKARQLLDNGKVTGMTQLEIAKEIFAHAAIYYSASKVKSIPGIGSAATNLIGHADPIDITNGGDTKARKVAFGLIWSFFPDEF